MTISGFVTVSVLTVQVAAQCGGCGQQPCPPNLAQPRPSGPITVNPPADPCAITGVALNPYGEVRIRNYDLTRAEEGGGTHVLVDPSSRNVLTRLTGYRGIDLNALDRQRVRLHGSFDPHDDGLYRVCSFTRE